MVKAITLVVTPCDMPRIRLYNSVRVLSWVVLLLMVAALAYSAVISVRYWSGIGV